MNVKFKMPKFGCKLTGKAWWRELLMTFIATTISIVLTFGTAGWLEKKKKEGEKREIVMMVMHDMDLSLAEVHRADSMLHKGYDIQLAYAGHPEEFEKNTKGVGIPIAEFQYTTENIVSSSIETINTIGNVLFVEDVSKFYMLRKQYMEHVVENFKNEIEDHSIMRNYEDFMNVNYGYFIFMSEIFILDMEKLFSQCKKIMKVTDGDLQQYQEKRAMVEREYNNDSLFIKLQEEYQERAIRLSEAMERGKRAKGN